MEEEKVEKVVSVSEELPKAVIRRIVKDKLSQCSSDGDLIVHKDAVLAFSESARIFIHYISATANDLCKESRRQTINADDVFKALEEIEFPEFVGPLKSSLNEFKQKNAEKKAGASEKEKKAEASESKVKKKRKVEEPSKGSDRGSKQKKGE